jgi:hypothetical protein
VALVGLVILTEVVRSLFYQQHFTSVLFADFLAPKNFKPKTQLCNFGRQDFVQKSARKTLMKLTAGLYFTINILRRHFKKLDQFQRGGGVIKVKI